MDEHERKLWNDYVKLLVSEIDEIVHLATNHGWKSRRYEQGRRYRERLGLNENNERQFTVIHAIQSTVV